MTSYLQRRGKRRYCDKSLGAAQHAGLLLRIWPGARFICLYRHPMDVIASGIEASPWGLTSYGFEPYIGSPPDNNVAALARYWLDYTTSIVAAEERFTDRCLPVRYEDLVTDPDGQIARILEFIGATPAPGIVARCFGPEHQRFGPGDYKIWNTSGVSADSVGRGWTMPAGKIAGAAARPGQRAGRRARLPAGRRRSGGPARSRPTCGRGRTARRSGGRGAPGRRERRRGRGAVGRGRAAGRPARCRTGRSPSTSGSGRGWRGSASSSAGPTGRAREGIGPAVRERARLVRRGRLVAARPGGGHGLGCGPGRGRRRRRATGRSPDPPRRGTGCWPARPTSASPSAGATSATRTRATPGRGRSAPTPGSPR